MRLVETDSGFVVKPDSSRRDSRNFAKALLEFLRQCGRPFMVGGSVERDILTIQPLSAKAWRIAWQAHAEPGAQ